MKYDDFLNQLRRHEGYRPYVYADTKNNLTCGWGHQLAVGSFIPYEVATRLLESDLNRVDADYRMLNLHHLDPARGYVIKNMLFHMGIKRLLTFKKMFNALHDSDFEEAAKELLDSKYGREFEGRANELAEQLKTGKYLGGRS